MLHYHSKDVAANLEYVKYNVNLKLFFFLTCSTYCKSKEIFCLIIGVQVECCNSIYKMHIRNTSVWDKGWNKTQHMILYHHFNQSSFRASWEHKHNITTCLQRLWHCHIIISLWSDTTRSPNQTAYTMRDIAPGCWSA